MCSIEIITDFEAIGSENPYHGNHPIGVAYSCFQNRSMEDRISIVKYGDILYYAVFDGHGEHLKDRPGEQVSSNHVVLHVRDNLYKYLFNSLGENPEELPVSDIVNRIIETFIATDNHMFNTNGAFGCTANIILVIGDYIYQINLGDSRSILYKDGYILSETIDQKPYNERERILKAKGYIENGRVNGFLAMSRAFGDFDFKLIDNEYSPEGPISCIPVITVTKRSDGIKFIMGTDGLFDGFNGNNYYLLNIIKNIPTHKKITKYLHYIVKGNNGDDDTTIISGDI